MQELLTITRAARLAGVSRSELQRHIHDGELETFEGKITVSNLLRLYPVIDMDSNPMLEKVKKIKLDAVKNKGKIDTALPSSTVLMSRLKEFSELLITLKFQLNQHDNLFKAIIQQVEVLQQSDNLETEINNFYQWLLEQNEQLQNNNSADNKAKLFVKDTFLRFVAAQVKFVPSGHEFFVEGSDSLLESAIRVGLKPNYGCSSGNCGSCKARLVSGDVKKTCEHDYVLSEYEKQMGYILMCSNTAITDLVIEAKEAKHPTDLPIQELRAIVKKKELLTDSLMILHLQTSQTKTLRFMAGQNIRLELESETVDYPIISCPCDGRYLQIQVKKTATDLSKKMFDDLQIGQTVLFTGPYGDFVLSSYNNPIVFIAQDEAFAPIKSLIEHAISTDTPETLYLYWLGEQYFDKLCRSWEDALDNFVYTPLTKLTELEQQLSQFLPTASDSTEFYLSGNDELEAILLNHGIHKSKIHISNF
ncbi:FAD-binding oxidoreductase [Candidatus Halobeggiatoa sp. HSG11]|nr:FAD-binding oxidoreductase [Candidatus Halobeggiatoa sp. HSG11]